MPLRVYKQGNLDGLCGVYSVVHAITHLLSVRTPNGYDEDLFSVVAGFVPKRLYPNVLWEGLTSDELFRVAKRTARHYKLTHDFDIDVQMPFSGDIFRHREEFFDAVDTYWRNSYCTFILWIDWPVTNGGAHWTVLREIRDDCLRLVDSDGVTRLPLKRLGVSGVKGTRLQTASTIMFTLKAVEGEPVS